MLRSLLLTILISGWFSSAVAADSFAEQFERANRLYEDKDYASAVQLYQSILDQGMESDALYFNLGNAYFKAGDLGRAVLNYKLASRLAPDNEDIRANLEFAQQYTSVQMEGVQLNPIEGLMEGVVGSQRLDNLAWACAALFVLTMVLLILRFGLAVRTSWLRTLTVAVVLALVLAGGLTTYKFRHDYVTRRAVIVAGEAPVYTGPSTQSELELRGAPGLIVEILDEADGFYNVLFKNKRRGWIAADLVAEI
ncbi:MAG: tetratricopeptide repeat protein [bacterium]